LGDLIRGMEVSHLDVAKQFIEDAKLCLDHDRFRSAVSRCYYAVFHACIALFEHYGYHPSNFIGWGGYPATRWEHGIITKYVHLEFVSKRRMIPWAMGMEVRRLYRSRVEADYRSDMTIAPSLAQETYDKAIEIITEVEKRVI